MLRQGNSETTKALTDDEIHNSRLEHVLGNMNSMGP